MIDFKEFKTDVFKSKSTSAKLLYLFMDALSFLDGYKESHSGFNRLDSDVSTDRFVIRMRFYDLDVLPVAVNWVTCQCNCFRKLCKDARCTIEIEPVIGQSYIDVKYSIYLNLPF